MTPSPVPSRYGELIHKQKVPPAGAASRNVEEELDTLITGLKERERETAGKPGSPKADPVRALREKMISEFIPIFVELVEKYSKAGVSMQMDASNLLEGGREIRFDFGYGDYRTQLMGTVTAEAIAFHETRYSPDLDGELVSGPMLRLRHLNDQAFRSFVCERLTLLLRAATRQR